MSVHKGISNQLSQKNREINLFIQLDKEREEAISHAVQLCKANESFTTERINELSAQINELAKQGSIPSRSYVTPQMVKEFVEKTRR